MQLIEAVNTLLRAIGDAPVSELDESNQRAALAEETLGRVRKRILLNGYSFNTDKITLSPDASGKVPIAKTYLKIGLPAELDVRPDGGTLYLWHLDKGVFWHKPVRNAVVVTDVDDFSLIAHPFAEWITREAAALLFDEIERAPAQHLWERSRRAMAHAINQQAKPSNFQRATGLIGSGGSPHLGHGFHWVHIG